MHTTHFKSLSVAAFIDRVRTDAGFTLRLLRRSPGFAVTLLGVLVVGMGATTAMFSVVMSLLLRPLPFPHPEELTMVWGTQKQVPLSPLSLADFLDWRAQGTTFSLMAAVEYDTLSLSSPDAKPESLLSANVSGDYFPMLGIAPLRGRLLGPDDDRVGGPRVAVVSAVLWRRRFGSDPGLVGRSIALNGEAYTVVGVAPEGFRFSGPSGSRCNVWTPLAVTNPSYARLATQSRANHFVHVMGRRRPAVSIGEAQAQLAGIAKSIEQAFPATNTEVGVRLVDLHDALVRESADGVCLLFAAVGLVLLLICANVANLLLARALSRRAEMAARVALGATRGRLVAQMLTETVTIFVIAALGGALLARWLVDVFAEGLVQGAAASAIPIHLDGASLAFSIGTSLVCGLLFGLVPAAEAHRVEPQAVLKESGTRASLGRSARVLRGGLVIGQVSLAFVLLVAGGLALRAFKQAASTPRGFDSTNLATATIILPPSKAADQDKTVAFVRDVLARVAALPGVLSVGANSAVPLAGDEPNGPFEIEGRPSWPNGTGPLLQRNSVTPGYFRTMGIPILRGRDFTDADVKHGRPVIVIGQATAERFFPGEDAIGQRINLGEGDAPTWREIVGVVGDVRRYSVVDPPLYEGYSPVTQSPVDAITIVARTPRVDALLGEMPGIVAAVDPEQAIYARAMSESVAASIGPERFVAELLAAFAAIGLSLATLGIFGLVSYTTSQRTRELGIRLALGSSRAGIVGVVMREGASLLGVGLVLGLGGAFLVGREVARRFYGAAAFDPLLFSGILVMLALAGLVASLLPALRASRIPPAVALRYE
jgi:putative ABC transport system permease protein